MEKTDAITGLKARFGALHPNQNYADANRKGYSWVSMKTIPMNEEISELGNLINP